MRIEITEASVCKDVWYNSNIGKVLEIDEDFESVSQFKIKDLNLWVEKHHCEVIEDESKIVKIKIVNENKWKKYCKVIEETEKHYVVRHKKSGKYYNKSSKTLVNFKDASLYFEDDVYSEEDYQLAEVRVEVVRTLV